MLETDNLSLSRHSGGVIQSALNGENMKDGTNNLTGKPAENRGFMMAVALLISLIMGMLYAFSIGIS